VAFFAAVRHRKAQVLEQVHRYAAPMEQVVEVDQRVFAGAPLDEVARAHLDGRKVGNYKGGLLILQGPRDPWWQRPPARAWPAAWAVPRRPISRDDGGVASGVAVGGGPGAGVAMPAHPIPVPLNTSDALRRHPVFSTPTGDAGRSIARGLRAAHRRCLSARGRPLETS
jgi:hypothetical protein